MKVLWREFILRTQRIEELEKRVERLERECDRYNARATNAISAFLTLMSAYGYLQHVTPKKLVETIDDDKAKDYREALIESIKGLNP